MPADIEPTRDLLMRAVGNLRRAWRETLEPLGISPHQSRALMVIADAGEIRPSELARLLRIAPRSATEVIDGLVSEGLVERRNSATDRRAVIVSPTPVGTDVIRRIDRARDDSAGAMFGRLSRTDETHLRRILRKMLDDEPTTG